MSTTAEMSHAGEVASRERLVAANIHPDTLLATDYLNHFNEMVMMIDLLRDMPECTPDVIAWQPCSYVEHFARSHFREKDLAVAAYAAVEPKRRACFERTIEHIDRAFADIQELILDAPMDGLPLADVADHMAMRVRPLLAHANGLIHGGPVVDAITEDAAEAQSAVDAVLFT